jgi:alpha-mannosidase
MLASTKLPGKIERLLKTYRDRIFKPIASLDVGYLETKEHLRTPPPADAPFKSCPSGTQWGEPWGNAWFFACSTVPESLANRPLHIRAETDGIEAMLWVDGHPAGIFTHPKDGAFIGDHHALRLTPGVDAGTTLHIAIEAYAGHPCVGSQPFDTTSTQSRYPDRYPRVFRSVQVLEACREVMDFVFDLRCVSQLARSLPEESFRRGRLQQAMAEVFEIVPQDPAHHSGDWLRALAEARLRMAPHLSSPANASAPVAGLVGHSHMDTAWMWPIEETIRKCARTYSNALSLMEQYPEYTFIQSTPLHAEFMRLHYPEIFAGIQKRVAEGRWEPNGGMWVECDCNLTGGESMVRQFLKGIRYTREHFHYSPDTFWLPDTFGYNASIPQIMRGFGLKYFLTTKLTWNESNTFPYDTFSWRGIDGSTVLAHFNDIQCWPDPETLIAKLHGGGPKDFRVVKNFIQHKDLNDRRLISYGMGDGGGGPHYEMLEMARRVGNLEDCPRGVHTTVGKFMRDLEMRTEGRLPVHTGELYLEGHRGSLTSIHAIKRLNRQAEIALRNLEILAVAGGHQGDSNVRLELDRLWSLLLVNQFHDILPGTSIPEVQDRARRELSSIVADANSEMTRLVGSASESQMTLWNTLSWDREGVLEIHGAPEGRAPADGCIWQSSRDVEDNKILLLGNLRIPPLASLSISLESTTGRHPAASPFAFDGSTLEWPEGRLVFSADGRLSSLIIKSDDREIAAPGGYLNTLLCGEDVPEAWDNWDIDDDQRLKMKPQAGLVSSEVIENGPLEFRLRQVRRIGHSSTITQDVVVRTGSVAVLFDTVVDWSEKHALLKVSFPTRLFPAFARHDIPFGHICRPVHRNTSQERAQFEVCQHKWSDISEGTHGVALLNDGKYGIAIDGGEFRLTLLKAGLHPDPRGDEGRHRFSYALLPHEGAFAIDPVVRRAWEMNCPLIAGESSSTAPLFTLSNSEIVCEAIKPAEDGHGWVIRLLEASGSHTKARLVFSKPPKSAALCNMLEEVTAPLVLRDRGVDLEFHPFEVLTILVEPTP